MKSRTLLVGALLLDDLFDGAGHDGGKHGDANDCRQPGGLSLFSWVFSAYLLASTVTVPIYGKLADLYGRKPVLLFGISLFLFGSALSGMAGSMVELILFRAIQGLGAGAVMPVTMDDYRRPVPDRTAGANPRAYGQCLGNRRHCGPRRSAGC